MKKFILPVLGIGALLTSYAFHLVAENLAKGAREVYFLVPHTDPAIIEFAEFAFEAKPGDKDYDKKVLSIYGVPFDDKLTVIIDPSRIKHPKLKPELSYVHVGTDKDERPWQLKTVEFVAPRSKFGASITGALLLVLCLALKVAAPAPGARSAAG